MRRSGQSMTQPGIFLLATLGIVAGTMAAADSAGRYRRPRVAAAAAADTRAGVEPSEADHNGASDSPRGTEETRRAERLNGVNRSEIRRPSVDADAEFGGADGAGPNDLHDLNPTPGDDKLLPPDGKTGEEPAPENSQPNGKVLKSSRDATASSADAQPAVEDAQPQDPQTVAWEKAEKERREKRQKEFQEQQRRAWEEAHRPTAWQLQNPSGLQNRDPAIQQRGYVAPNTYFGPQFRSWNNQTPPVAVRELPPNRTMVPPVTRTNVMLAPNTYYGSGNSRWNQISPSRATINPLGGWNLSPGW